ncbi:DUF3152 domain-containing protein [Rhodococcus pyridinivorans]|uniref:DUF3152 domain-containing protein n=1 Tax=Rhodococcus pyridinivorans TaxID=103816 RepID=UPI0035314BF0
MIERGGVRESRGPQGSSPTDPSPTLPGSSRSRGTERPEAGRRSHQPLRAVWDPVGRPDRPPRRPRPERDVRKQTRVGRFVATYGWRAYAVPILAVVTLIVLWDAARGAGAEEPADQTDASEVTEIIVEAPQPEGTFPESLESGALPEGGPFTEVGAREWRVVPGTTGQVGAGQTRVFTYTVELEEGIDTTGYGGDAAFASMVDRTLADPRSWIGDEAVAFRRIDTGEPDFRISLTSQMTIREGCGYDIPLEGSCFNPSMERVFLNEARWVRGAVAFQGDIGSYRQYLVNHEVGHAIGLAQHDACTIDGGLAPIMMQQTFGTANDDIARLDPDGAVPADGLRCRFNPWPYPRA